MSKVIIITDEILDNCPNLSLAIKNILKDEIMLQGNINDYPPVLEIINQPCLPLPDEIKKKAKQPKPFYTKFIKK